MYQLSVEKGGKCINYVETHWIMRRFQQLAKVIIKPFYRSKQVLSLIAIHEIFLLTVDWSKDVA